MRIAFLVLFPILALFVGGLLYRFAYAYPRQSFGELLRPACHACGARLPKRYLIPIFGALLSGARCPACGEKRGVGCLLSEVTFALATFLLFFFYDLSFLFLVYLVATAVLLVLSLVDLDIKEVPHGLLLVLILLGVLLFILSFFPKVSLTGTLWWEHLVGAVAVSIPLFIIMVVSGGGVGGGDVKLMFCLGLLLGYKLVLLSFLFGIVLAALFSIALIVIYGKNGKYALPLVPFLSVGAFIAMLCGEKLISLFF